MLKIVFFRDAQKLEWNSDWMWSIWKIDVFRWQQRLYTHNIHIKRRKQPVAVFVARFPLKKTWYYHIGSLLVLMPSSSTTVKNKKKKEKENANILLLLLYDDNDSFYFNVFHSAFPRFERILGASRFGVDWFFHLYAK